VRELAEEGRSSDDDVDAIDACVGAISNNVSGLKDGID
jgi:hypothetical protein